MKKLLFVLVFVGMAFASKWGETIIIDEDGTPVKVSSDSALHVTIPSMSFNGDSALKVVLPGKVSDENSTTTPLGIDGVFTGEYVNILNFAAVVVVVYTNKESAINGLELLWSSDSVHIDECDEYTIPESNGKVYTSFPVAKYLAVRYTNGSVAQDTFRLQTILKRTNVMSSSHRANDSISGEDDVVVSKSIITGKAPGGNYINFEATNAGNFKMSLEELENNVSTNSNTQLRVSIFDSIGRSPSIDATTYALNTIGWGHHELHDGDHYYLQGFLELSNDDTFHVKLVTPNTTKWAHFVYNIKSTGICETYFDEGAVGGMTGGASVIPLNNNRNSTNTSGLVFTSGVTNATTYTVRLESNKWGADGFKETIGGGSGREDELMLKQNTTYLRTFISKADDNIVQFKASWYEHTNKE